jgi:hypothetical protein
MSGLFTPYAFVGDSLTLANVQSQGLSPDVQAMIARAGGSLDPALISASFIEPKIKIGTPDLTTLLGAGGVSLRFGKAFTSAWKLQYQQRDSAGGAGDFTTGSTHLVASGTKALAIVNSISAENDNRAGALAQCTVYPCSTDGYASALSISAAASLTGSIAVGKVFALGPVLCEGLAGGLGGVQRATINLGVEVAPDRENGRTFPTRYTIKPRNPMVEIEAKNGAIAALLGMMAGVGTGMTVYLQRFFPGADRYAFDQAEHIAVSFSTGTYVTEEIGVDAEGDAMTKFKAMVIGALSWTVNTTISVP